MHSLSHPVTSSQPGVHEHLARVVARHASSTFLKPVSTHTQAAFALGFDAWQRSGAPLIIDAGCGVGMSTLRLAARFPAHFVLGIDQSADRLSRTLHWPGERPANCLLLRADLIDFWRLMHEHRMHPERHYLLYPNPWPKKAQLGRRWHGHPVFPTLVALGGMLECRSNWEIYVEEFGAALRQLTSKAVVTEALPDDPAGPLTPFEAKYRRSGHALWRCRLQLETHAGMPHRS
jgi:tRNA (guanine-N7-)-methyltransferase